MSLDPFLDAGGALVGIPEHVDTQGAACPQYDIPTRNPLSRRTESSGAIWN